MFILYSLANGKYIVAFAMVLRFLYDDYYFHYLVLFLLKSRRDFSGRGVVYQDQSPSVLGRSLVVVLARVARIDVRGRLAVRRFY